MSLRDNSYDPGPRGLHPPTRHVARGPGRGVTRGMGLAAGVTQEMPAAQWIPAYAGMTTDGARGDKDCVIFLERMQKRT